MTWSVLKEAEKAFDKNLYIKYLACNFKYFIHWKTNFLEYLNMTNL